MRWKKNWPPGLPPVIIDSSILFHPGSLQWFIYESKSSCYQSCLPLQSSSRWTPRTSRVQFLLNLFNYFDCLIWLKYLNAAGCCQKAPHHHHQSTLAWWCPSLTDLIAFFQHCDKRFKEQSGFSAQVSIRQHQRRVQIISLSQTDAGQSSQSITADASFMWSLILSAWIFFFPWQLLQETESRPSLHFFLSVGWGWPTWPRHRKAETLYKLHT